MEHYVTLFNSLFLPQGLALHMSMERHIKQYVLWILCVDDIAYEVLDKLQLPNVRLLNLRLLETTELKNIKSSRNIGEYCWTLTPYAPRFVFEADQGVSRVTYLDADLWFKESPSIIFKELEDSKKNVLITEHGYAPEYDQSVSSGKYCVQFITFEKNNGEEVRKWWEEKCTEWCFDRIEDGKFGDQKYLDDWPDRFSKKVHVLLNKGLTLAPWNACRYPYGNAVFYHFHGLRIISPNKISVGNYYLPKALYNNVYLPYFADLKNALKILKKNGAEFRSQNKRLSIHRKIYRTILKIRTSIQNLTTSGDVSW